MIKQPLLAPIKRSRKRSVVQPKNKTLKLSSEIKRLATQINRASFYERLNVSSQASDSEIKKAFHKLSLKVHPDRCHLRMATCLFQRICEAKDCLLDPMKRQLYDQSLNQPKTDVMADSQTDLEASDSDDGWSRMDNVDMNYQPINVVMDEFFDRVFSNRDAIYNDLSLFSTNLFLKDNGTIPWTDIPNSLNPIETNPRLDQYIDRVLELYGVNQINYKHCSILEKSVFVHADLPKINCIPSAKMVFALIPLEIEFIDKINVRLAEFKTGIFSCLNHPYKTVIRPMSPSSHQSVVFALVDYLGS